MSRSVFVLLLLVSILCATNAASAADATDPVFFNAKIHPLGSPSPDLEGTFAALLERQQGPAWATYTVPMIAGRRMLCCGDPSPCFLERSGDVPPEGSKRNVLVLRDDGGHRASELRVLLRFGDRRVSEIRAFSSDCRLDAGGLPVYLWQGVAPRLSLDFLTSGAAATGTDVAEGALVAIAHHDEAEVDRILEHFARGESVPFVLPGGDLPRLEEEAVFWLGEARGTGGFEVLERLRHELQDTDILEQMTFALHLNEAPGALPALIDMARREASSEVRGTALFWLSQQAGERATAAIAVAGEEDPDLEVKERAVFALSQLPPDRGVPLLIRFARTHDSREIRKKAIFWLGQTEDPRALDFFEDILTH